MFSIILENEVNIEMGLQLEKSVASPFLYRGFA